MNAHGALALLAALDVRTGKVFASCPQTTGIAPFMTLIGQVMSHEPYNRRAPGVRHRGQRLRPPRHEAAIRRLRDAHPNAIMIHTPVHASWLNQAEIVFSVVQKKILSPNDFASHGPARRCPAGLHRPLQPDRPALQLDLHRRGPGQAPPANQHPPGTPVCQEAA